MKQLKKHLALIILTLYVSCSKNTDTPLGSVEKRVREVSDSYDVNYPKYSKTELIVAFHEKVTKADKKELRTRYGVISFQPCDLCEDGLIEKWKFGDDVNIEDKKLSIESGSGGPEGDITNVDCEFTFKLETAHDKKLKGTNKNSFLHQIVAVNKGVTIAVLDTGVDAQYPLFTSPFLYNSSRTSHAGEPSGWDFVNHDADCYDDYRLIHGTKVSYIVNKRLKDEGIPHQILPVKVCDKKGVASYFNILCGLKYALPKANIIQMSLGWYNKTTQVQKIFNQLVDNYSEKVLIVTSAGNHGVDNDVVGHYPSSYPQSNLVAIAAANSDYTDIAYFSNYGEQSVDFYALGEDVVFYDINNTPIPISGTSYAAPIVTAVSAGILYQSGMSYTPAQIIHELKNVGVY